MRRAPERAAQDDMVDSSVEVAALVAQSRADRAALEPTEGPSWDVIDDLLPWCCRLALWIQGRVDHLGVGTLVVGIAGAQGAGKTTLQRLLCGVLDRGLGLTSVGLSIDDLYLTRDDRAALARDVHPLFATRGAPGTHDTALGIRVLRELRNAGPETVTLLPGFDKTRDERRPESEWRRLEGRPRVVILEGWCVGALAEREAELRQPVNELEREKDADGRHRRHVNQELETRYAALFAELDALVMLRVPGSEYAFTWRLQAELEARARLTRTGGDRSRLMDEAGIRRFVQLDERVTRHMLREMPARADVLLEVGPDHRIRSSRFDGQAWHPGAEHPGDE